jgi:polar amino acid transport system substrate-binding protein
MMRQISQNYRTGELKVVDVATPRAPRGGILVQTSVSLISAGTERSLVTLARKNLLEKARSRPDLVTKVLDKLKREGALAALETVRSKLETPIPLGYSLAGRVLDVGSGASGFARGDRVACAGAGFANHAEANAVPLNMAVQVPAEVSDEEASFVTVGSIALQGVRLVRPALGETVAVIGLGLIGQIAASLLRAHGCDVVAIDIDRSKVELALRRGAAAGAVTGADDAVEVVRALSRGRGADAVVITASSSSNEPLVLAGELARDKARISVVGLMPLEIPRKAYYEKELEVVISRSYGPGRYDPDYEERGRDYPVGYVRWTERRNLEAVVRAIATKRLDVAGLITHRFPFDKVLDAYALISAEHPEPHLGVVLTYPERELATPCSPARVSARPVRGTKVGLAVVGTGSFATGVLLPKIAKTRQAEIVATVSGRGLSARHAADLFGSHRVAASLDEALAMPEVDTVVIATRHNSHAAMASKALLAGRNVFVEKPAAIDEEQLAELRSAALSSEARFMVGFNRRFSPFARQVRETFAGRKTELIMTARINAGRLGRGTWVTDSEEGGGRIIGEACHFIDLFSFWSGSIPVRVSAHAIGPEGGASREENVVIALDFADGSIGSLVYASMGDPSIGKESYEIIGEGRVASIHDWRALEVTGMGKTHSHHALRADKGHEGELAEFFEACREGKASPISWESIEATTEATFAAERSWRDGISIALDPQA